MVYRVNVGLIFGNGSKWFGNVLPHYLIRIPYITFPSLASLAAGLRTPLAVPGPYPGAFGMLPHPAGMNGELAGAAGAAAYAAGLHNMSPQMSAAAAAAVAAYGRSPMVSGRRDSRCVALVYVHHHILYIKKTTT